MGERSLKAGDRNKNQTSKLGQQRQKLDPKVEWELKEEQLRHALKWGGVTAAAHGWKRFPTGRPWWSVNK